MEKQQVTNDYTGEAGASFKLLPGTYDVVVANQEDAGSPGLHFDGIVIEAGKTVEKVAEFSGGDAQGQSRQEGQTFFGALRGLPGRGGGEDREQLTNDYTGEAGASFKLVPGTYDIVVEDSETQIKKEVKGTVVGAGHGPGPGCSILTGDDQGNRILTQEARTFRR